MKRTALSKKSHRRIHVTPASSASDIREALNISQAELGAARDAIASTVNESKEHSNINETVLPVPNSLKEWLGDGSEEVAIDSRTAYQWIYALLADREGLVRYVRAKNALRLTSDKYKAMEMAKEATEAYKALSQELRDEIEDGGEKTDQS